MVILCFIKTIQLADKSSFSFACECLSSFLSDRLDYYESPIITDPRLESLEERRLRAQQANAISIRSRTHSLWALEMKILEVLLPFIEDPDFSRRSTTTSTIAKIVNSFNDLESMKTFLTQLLQDQLTHQNSSIIRQLMKLEACLLQSLPELGVWVLNQFQVIEKLIWLINSQDEQNIEVASEVIALAANSDSSAALLQPLIEQNLLPSLLHHQNPYVQSNSASALTKLSIKAKALTEESEENSVILNALRSILKGSSSLTEGNHASSIERCIETLAALVSKSYIKDEIVFGSSRTVACIEELIKVPLPEGSTANYGLAHILSALTVTNRELKALALIDKEITLDQYEQLQELNKIKLKEEQGESFVDKEEVDRDNAELCQRRIKRIVTLGGIPCLLRLAKSPSSQVKRAACKALRQICVVEASRGIFLQGGGLKVCGEISADEHLSKDIRFEAAHAIAKTLVTTNPNLLSEHNRLGALRPLLLLCSEVDASQLQQFESLLSITNLTSCGEAEQNHFVDEKGIQCVHYLMFSNNLMVRRAATEALCNIATHDAMIKVLRDSEKIKLWLAFSEDWTDFEDIKSESFLTARAAIGTIAMSCSDELVADALVRADCMRSFRSLLASENVEVTHRVLVAVSQLLELGKKEVILHLIEGGLVLALQSQIIVNLPELNSLAKTIALNLVTYSKDEKL